MTKVDQTVVDNRIGNCMQATVASLLDLELDQVPNFIKYDAKIWWDIYAGFFRLMGYRYSGYGWPVRDTLKEEDSINGYFDAAVHSRTFPGCAHAVIIDINGVVVHDPNPNKAFQGVNVIETGELDHWIRYEKIND